MGRKSIISKLRKFKEQINRKYPVERMILFGSQAEGRAGADSDIDLMIVSTRFQRLDFMKRATKMYDFWDLDSPVDFLCFTPKEFKDRAERVTIVSEALKHGINI